MKAVSMVVAMALALMVNAAVAQEYFGDVRPDAPELAARGPEIGRASCRERV